MTCYYCLVFRLHSSFPSGPNNIFYSKGYNSESFSIMSFFFHSGKFLRLSLIFMTLTFLKIAGQLFCSPSLNLAFSGVSSRLDSDFAYLAGISQKQCWGSSQCILSGGVIWIFSITDEVHFEPLIQVVSATFPLLHCQVILFLLGINTYFFWGGRYLETVNIPILVKISIY